MGKYNFDEIVPRKNTNSLKYDFSLERGRSHDVMPLWVADMDFTTVPEIKNALIERANHAIYGYTLPKDDFLDTVIQWMKKRHNFDTKREWYTYTPGVVFAISMAIRALTKEGDSVLIQNPVYYPFTNVVIDNGRKLVVNSLVYGKDSEGNGRYTIDFEDFEDKIVRNKVKVFVLCNPHNPVGRVWTVAELEKIGDICLKHNVTVVSDEIHEDFIFSGHTHVPFASVKPEYEAISITCTSPSKTFNLAGLQLSNIIIPNSDIKLLFDQEIGRTGYDEPNIFGMVACQNAYTYGEDWLEELKEYLLKNLRYVEQFVKEKLPKVIFTVPEGTYLVWLDFNAYGLERRQLRDIIEGKAKLWLDNGLMFGKEGSGFERINIAAPRSIIIDAMESLYEAFKEL
jgi:cystathionine beta-lyase